MLRLFLFAALLPLSCLQAQNQSPATARIAAQAERFLATLEPVARSRVLFDFQDEAQRKRWSNFPTGIFERKGLRMGELNETQRKAALALLSSALSPSGYQKVLAIMEADEQLKLTSRGNRNRFGKDEYYISFLGAPSPQKPWCIQFGGHHLALNLLLVGAQGILTPSHTAAQPAIYERDGKTIRPLGAENDKAFALLASLDETQRKKAILGFEVRDMILGPLADGKTIEPEGLRASEMNAKQQEMLLGLAEEWVGMVEKSVAAARMRQLRSEINETWFAWSGSPENGQAAYFRIQGPSVVIEYSPQSLGGDLTKHIHTIYRDPRNDYGKLSLAK